MKKFILLKHKEIGNVFWTTNTPDADHSDYKVLFESDDQDEMINEWRKAYVKSIINGFNFLLGD